MTDLRPFLDWRLVLFFPHERPRYPAGYVALRFMPYRVSHPTECAVRSRGRTPFRHSRSLSMALLMFFVRFHLFAFSLRLRHFCTISLCPFPLPRHIRKDHLRAGRLAPLLSLPGFRKQGILEACCALLCFTSLSPLSARNRRPPHISQSPLYRKV